MNLHDIKQPSNEKKLSFFVFSNSYYKKNDIFVNMDQDVNCLLFCQKGKIHFISNLFKEELIHAGEMIFIPRMADYRGEIMENTNVIVHTFNNSICRPQNSMLNYLHEHRQHIQSKGICYHCKLSMNKAIQIHLESISNYLIDNIGDKYLWHLKHKELIELFYRYYNQEELYSFFHPLVEEDAPFKSLVLAHYLEVQTVQELASVCGYGIETFRRIFSNEFGLPAYQWLQKKKAEHINYRLSLPYVSLKEIIEEFNFTSPQQLSRFCKNYLGDTPTNLRKYFNK